MRVHDDCYSKKCFVCTKLDAIRY